MSEELLAPGFMHRLDALDVLSRKVLRGAMQGERRSKKRGQSVEFADYRNYVEGDDLRRIDWNLYARLDKLFLRLFLEEEDLSLSIAIDATASMDYGTPDKLLFAKRLAAALGYIGLSHYNRVNLFTLSGHGSESQLTGLRGRRPIPRMLEYLENLEPAPAAPEEKRLPTPFSQGGTLEAVCRRLALLQRQPGIVVLISDFLDKGDPAAALRYFATPRYDAYAIHVLSPQEVDPAKGDVIGDLRLRDAEDASVAEVSITSTLINKYKANLEAWCDELRDACLRRGVLYTRASTDEPFEDLVLIHFRQRGLVG